MSILENGIYHANSLDFLEHIPDRSVQVAYLDPPTYAHVRDTMSLDAYKGLVDKTIRQLYRILRLQGSIYVHSDARNALYIRPFLVKYFTEEMYVDEIPLQNVRGAYDIITPYRRSEHAKTYTVFRSVNSEEIKGFEKDSNGKLYRLYSLLTQVNHPTLQFEFKGYTPTRGSWKYSRDKLEEYDRQGLIVESNNAPPRLKKYLTTDQQLDVTDDWSDVPDEVTKHSREYLGFDTQRPTELLRRIILNASDVGDVVIDPFCGSGTSLVAAHKAGRKWVGCDLSQGAYELAVSRLQRECNLTFQTDFLTGTTAYLRSQFPIIHSSAYRRFFISYSRKDSSDFVDPLCQELKDAGLDIWLDRQDIPIGSEWRKELEKALDQCEAMILCLSPDALHSTYVNEEWRTFMAKNKLIYQIMCRDTYVPPELDRFHRTDFVHRQTLITQLKSMS